MIPSSTPRVPGPSMGDFSDPRPGPWQPFPCYEWQRSHGLRTSVLSMVGSHPWGLGDLDEGSHGFFGDPDFLNPWDIMVTKKNRFLRDSRGFNYGFGGCCHCNHP